ncbi:MAG: macro domain-containing protein, partial [Leptospiraceae bacterium]|nr:macro domain-containing protein [Leptospiraceae bacterium]
GGNLLARYVIHAVGPIWEGGGKNESQLLASAYEKSLRIAQEKNLETIAFPNISTGVYGFPKEEASEIAIQIVKKFLNESKFPKKVIFVCFDEENYAIYKRRLQQDI